VLESGVSCYSPQCCVSTPHPYAKSRCKRSRVMLAAHRTLNSATQGALRSCTARHVNFAPPVAVGRRLLVARASKDSKSWGEIAAEAVEVAK
jgi:hypothetical protein